ncbi:ImmA/IrrE family metallo-endopeptidase [Paenibacillus sp. LX16]|uniref:ImmA/IrrE family metallo-endopeptidase n=1 Tax=Paenibacillus sp. LX16 TaxID=1740264 RepID=UPI002E2A2E44|nr:ImmA/IrrE family metallo-endopeptidase [Paenibacillus sp. LX16]
MKTMKMTTIYKANYNRAENAAYELLKTKKITSLPVKVKLLSKKFPNFRIKTYTWFSVKYGMTIEDVCDFADSNEGCCYYQKSKHQYLILYNDTVDNVGRVRWTIAHELGHFILKHNEISAKTIIARNSLTKKEYIAFESEANCFARTLLAPPKVISALGRLDASILSELCQISFEAASNVLNFLNRGIEMGRNYTSKTWSAFFKNFIWEYKYGTQCLNCNHYFVQKDVSFCPTCGGNNLARGKGSVTMIYTKIELDELNRACQCPRCNNESVVGEYCQICGTYLVNKCTGFSGSDIENPFNGSWHDLEQGCGEYLDGDSRFCTKCGSTSTFYESGLLQSWEKNNQQSKPNSSDDSFTLPF